jgi:hypothetical protein
MHPDGYFALVLDAASAEVLKRSFATLDHPIAHHCTVRYGSSCAADLPSPFAATDLGRTYRLKVIGHVRLEGKVEAVAVALVLPDGKLLERGFSENAIPHVTVATDGVEEPARANDLLASGFARIDGPLLEARLEHTRASSNAVRRDEPGC